MNPRIASLEKMIDGPRDGALLRFSLGNEYLKEGELAKAEISFRAAVDRDKHYSAAWKALGKTLVDANSQRRHWPLRAGASLSPRHVVTFRRPRK
jgi:uncharacterized protein HemY